jgi:site-specific DNA recombinase
MVLLQKHMTVNDKKLHESIMRGTYADCFLIYTRKSTDEDNNQKNSLSYQMRETRKFADRERLKVANISIKNFCQDGVISEKHSGFKDSIDLNITDDGHIQYKSARPKFSLLTQYLNQKYFKGLVCLSYDRLSRNKSDNNLLDKLMRQGVEVKFVYASYDDTSSGALHMDIDGMFAVHHSRVTSEKVRITTRNLREQGVCTYKAPVGYLNTGNMHEKPFDPVRAPLVKDLFEKYDTGEWTLHSLARWASDVGFVMPAVRRRRTEDELLGDSDDSENKISKIERPVTYGNIHKILSNSFYKGYIIGPDGFDVKSVSHTALVSEELFSSVQQKLKKKKVSQHYSVCLDHPYRKLVRCVHCERLYTPYEKKGATYYGSKCKAGCVNSVTSFNTDVLENKVAELLSRLYFTPEELEEFEYRVQTDLSLVEASRQRNLRDIEQKKKRLREEQKYLRDNKLTLLKAGAYTPVGYIEEDTRISNEIQLLLKEEVVSEEAMLETMKDIVTLSELLKNITGYYEHAKTPEREKIARIIFSELYMTEDTLKFKLTTGMKPFESKLLSVCDPTENRTPITRMKT